MLFGYSTIFVSNPYVAMIGNCRRRKDSQKVHEIRIPFLIALVSVVATGIGSTAYAFSVENKRGKMQFELILNANTSVTMYLSCGMM